MIDLLYISETGLKTTQAWLDQVSNNVANIHTPGYKKVTANFMDLVSHSTSSDYQRSDNSITAFSGMGSRIAPPTSDFSEGSLKATNRMLDIAISGSGLFEVVLDNGEFAYTRLGRMEANNEGLLTINGFVLSDYIQVPIDIHELEIRKNGVVVGKGPDTASETELGRVQLANIVNIDSLRPIGNSLYKSDFSEHITLGAPSENGNGEILQGFLEMSNVNLVDEMTNLVLAQRAYQLNARIIQTADQVLETINNLRR